MPHIITLPGMRDGPDNIFESQTLTGGVREVPTGSRAYSSLGTLFSVGYSGASVINRGTIWNISSDDVGSTIAGYYVNAVDNFGRIISDAPNGNAYGVSVFSGGSRVHNSGEIFAIAGEAPPPSTTMAPMSRSSTVASSRHMPPLETRLPASDKLWASLRSTAAISKIAQAA